MLFIAQFGGPIPQDTCNFLTQTLSVVIFMISHILPNVEMFEGLKIVALSERKDRREMCVCVVACTVYRCNKL